MSSSTSSSDLPRYGTIAVVTMMVSFAVIWVWVACMPMAYLDPEYPNWRAKQVLLERCDLGEVLILGDSRAAVGIIPAILPMKTTNFAVGGGEAVEALVALDRALLCPVPPRLVVVSFDPAHFAAPELFWERTMRFGFLNAAELADLRDVSAALHDPSIYEERHTDGVPSFLRDRLYTWRFPPYFFASLVKGGGFLRWHRNHQALEAAIASRGQYYFGTADGSGLIAAEGRLRAFQPLPVLDHYFERILARLHARGIPAIFIAMPVNESTARATSPTVQAAFASWLVGYAARYPGFRVVGPAMRAWPDQWFGDGFSHLNPAGAQRFSALLGPCLMGACAGLPGNEPWTVAQRE